MNDYVLELPINMLYDLLDYDVELAIAQNGEMPIKQAKTIDDYKALARRLNS